MASQVKAIAISLLILAITICCEAVDSTTTAIPPGGTTTAIPPGATVAPGGTTTTAIPPGATVAPGGTTTVPPGATVAPGGTTTTAIPPDATVAPGGTTTTTPPSILNGDHSELTFFMHDILGGSRPSAIAVTGIVANPAVGGQVPFAKPNGAVLPVNNGIPTNNNNGGIVNNNNIPFLTGLSGFTNNVFQNNNNGNNNNNIIGGVPGFPVLNSAQFPSGTTLQKLMFGTMTVFDDELTEGHELGSGLVGKAQGFYVASSEDGLSQTMLFTVMFASGSYADSLSFFGVHRSAVAESHLAIMGGTGKYLNAKGFALVKTFPGTNQQETDGVETLLQISVYLAY